MEFRALYPEELETWLDHVTTVFTGGRQYFSNHWHNDPWRDAEGIRIAVDDMGLLSAQFASLFGRCSCTANR